MNSLNLTEGRQGYLVRRAFIPNGKLEKDILHGGNNGVIKPDGVPSGRRWRQNCCTMNFQMKRSKKKC
jgi:hypothetical protein